MPRKPPTKRIQPSPQKVPPEVREALWLNTQRDKDDAFAHRLATRTPPAGAKPSDAAPSAPAVPKVPRPSRPLSHVLVPLPAVLVDRADRLIPVAPRLPAFAAMDDVSRISVIKVALARGLALLERDAARLPTWPSLPVRPPSDR